MTEQLQNVAKHNSSIHLFSLVLEHRQHDLFVTIMDRRPAVSHIAHTPHSVSVRSIVYIIVRFDWLRLSLMSIIVDVLSFLIQREND